MLCSSLSPITENINKVEEIQEADFKNVEQKDKENKKAQLRGTEPGTKRSNLLFSKSYRKKAGAKMLPEELMAGKTSDRSEGS